MLGNRSEDDSRLYQSLILIYEHMLTSAYNLFNVS